MKNLYLTEFIKHAGEVGSIVASSRFTIKRILKNIDFEKTKLIVEHGPATGCITKEILKKMKSEAELHLFETNKNFCKELEKIKDNRLKIHNTSAEKTSQTIKNKADIIISGIPLTTMPKETSKKILADSNQSLNETGKYIHYQFSPLAKKIIKQQFTPKMQYEILNIPPVFIFVCPKTN